MAHNPQIANDSQTAESDANTSMPSKRFNELFPRTDFPWHVIPESIRDCLQQLARSCATSARHLVGIMFCLVASCLGRTVKVRMKKSWGEPLIFWQADIRESGDGKSPPGNMMAQAIHAVQKLEQDRYEKEMRDYSQLPQSECNITGPPAKSRSYYATDITLEGLREEMKQHPHGGLVLHHDELSGFLSSQNQYKPGGSDREGWLSLWSGSPTRAVRVSNSFNIAGASVSLFGGVQPAVFAKAFGGNGGLYLVDGTVFRFLFTFERPEYYELTVEPWDDVNRNIWEELIQRALNFGDKLAKEQGGIVLQPRNMVLDAEAQECFLSWRNQLAANICELPPSLRGFLPKAYSYALRLTGVIHCIWRFADEKDPDTFFL
jgi:hypothetical protein